MKILPDADGFQTVTEAGIRLVGSIMLLGLAAVLVSAWVLSGSFCELGKWIVSNEKLIGRIK